MSRTPREFITHRGGRPRKTPYTGSGTDFNRDIAACRDADPEIFFPVNDDDPGHLAKGYCRGTDTRPACPVRQACLDWAIGHGEDHGVWGGLTRAERRRLRAHRPERSVA